MIVQMTKGATAEDVDNVVQRAKSLGLGVQLNLGTEKTVVALLGSNTGQLSTDIFAVLPKVESVTRIMKPYKLVSREFKAEDSLVSCSGIDIGGERVIVMAGPCAVESAEQLTDVAKAVKESGASILRGGAFKPNNQVILCERGIRTFEDTTRFSLDISSIPVIKRASHLPVIVDPSHAAGHYSLVPAIAKAAVAAGADGLLIEVHPNPKEAMIDGLQSLTPLNFTKLMEELRPIAKSVGRYI